VKRSNRLVLLVGILLAALAFVAIVILLNRPSSGGADDPEVPQTVTVLVATEDIDLAEAVTPDKVEPQEVPPGAVIGTALSSTTQVQGQPALIAVPAGAQVSGEVVNIGGTGIIDVGAMLSPGEKAIAVRVDGQTGAGFLARPGNVIDIVVSAETTVLQPTADSAANPDGPTRFEEVTGLEGARTVKAVLQNKRVLYVSATRAEEPQQQDTNDDGVIDEEDAPPAAQVIESVIIVFAGNDQDAEVIKFAQRDSSELSSERTEIPYSVSIVIRHLDDDAIEETTGVTLDSLVEEFGLRIPGIVEQLNEEGTPAP
jgi:Flp pilus assembly protein CpaB